MNISELMSKDPCTVTPDTPVSEAARLMKEEDVGMVPVIERVGGAEPAARWRRDARPTRRCAT